MSHAPIRYAFRRFVRIDCQVVRQSDFRLVGDLALDLSTRGMRVRGCGAKVLTGEELIVTFRPPRSNQWIDSEATVARVLHGRRPLDSGLCFGIEFHAMSAEDEEHLFAHLRGLGGPESERPPRSLLPDILRAA